ncbi:MAG: hypothetical protein ACLRT4_16295 [Thomasclavelia sp.]
MLKTLIKVRFLGLLQKTIRSTKQEKVSKAKIILMIFLLAYLGVFILGGCGYLFNLIIEPFTLSSFKWLYFALMAIMIVFLVFVGSIFMVWQEIYGAKDNDLLLAMPIKPRNILLSRVLMILILDYLYEALIALPAIIVYFSYQPFDLLKLIIFMIVLITLPMFVLAISCVFAWLLALVLKRINNKTFITLLFSLILLGAYFYLVNQLPNYLMNLVANGAALSEAIEKVLFPIYHLSLAISDNNLISLAMYLIIVVVLVVVVIYLLSKNFINLTTTKTGSKKGKLKQTDIKANSLKKSLLLRELRHFTSNAMVMLNAGMGLLFTVFLAGVLLVKGNDLMMLFNGIPLSYQTLLNEWLAGGLCLAIATTNSFNFISASLISLEGNNLWILKTLPIKTKDILESKILLHLLLCIPAGLLVSIIAIIIFKLGIGDSFLVITVPIVFAIFEAILGLLINLWKPKFDYVNETVVVKQSMAVIISMLAMFALIIVVVGGYIGLFSRYLDVTAYTYVVLVVFVILDIFSYYLLNSWGVKRFEEL